MANSLDSNKIKAFLDKISAIESSSGKNFNHREMESGIHKGTSAIGRFGLMPKTVDEVLNRSKQMGMMSSDLKQLSKMSPDEKKDFLEANPEIEYKLAEQLAAHVLNKQQGDEEKAAYSWLYGHNLTPENIGRRDYMEDPYVQKYKKLEQQRTPASAQTEPEKSPRFGLSSEESNKLKDYLSNMSPENNQPVSLLSDEDRKMHELIMKGGLFGQNSTPEDEKYIDEHTHPMIKGLMSGGMATGELTAVGKAGLPYLEAGAKKIGEEAAPFLKKGFSRLAQMLGKKPQGLMTAEEQAAWVAKQADNPAVKEVLDPQYLYQKELVADQGEQAILRQMEKASKPPVSQEEIDAIRRTKSLSDDITNVLGKRK